MGAEPIREMEEEAHNQLALTADQPVQLRAVRQLREGFAQIYRAVPMEVGFAHKAAELLDQRQCDYFAATQRTGPAAPGVDTCMSLAEVIDLHVERGEKGVCVEHERDLLNPGRDKGWQRLQMQAPFHCFLRQEFHTKR
jgi:hypothetical protein